MKYNYHILFFIVTIFISFESQPQTIITDSAAEITPTKFNDKISLLYIDPQGMNEDERFKVLSALSILSAENNAFDTIKIKPRQSLFTIFKDNFNFELRDRFNFKNSLQNVVKALNNLSSDYRIFSGEQLSIPTLPKRPSVNSTSKAVQFIDIYKNKKAIALTDVLSFKGEVVSDPNHSLENAAIWAYNLNTSDYNRFKILITVESFNKLYGKSIIQVREPVFTQVLFPIENDNVQIQATGSIQNTALIEKIKGIEAKFYSKYYILDFFNNAPCPHGDKVLDVIKSRLKEFQIDKIVDTNIIPIPINYFDNETMAIKFLEGYYNVDLNKHPELRLWKINGDATITSLKKIKLPSLRKCPTCIPEIYLNACLKYYYNKKPDVISTSFYVSTSDGDLMPKFFGSSPTNLITATLNEPGRKIEDLFNREPNIDGSPLSSIEPLSALYLNYTASGGIIVGNKIDKGKFYGMYSANGDRVSILGKGIGWGNENSCIKTADKGASFATPDVGVELFIAKAFWRSKALKVTPVEARKRLLLSVDIEPEFIGQFASPGTCNMNKLLSVDDAIGEGLSENIFPIKILENSQINYNTNKQVSFGNDPNEITGLTFINNQTFAFFNSTINWREIIINNISIRLQVNNISSTYNDIDSFRKNFRQIIFFK
jgi:hypothetical protein